MLVAIRCISVGEESKRGLKEDAGQEGPEETFNLENNNILIVGSRGEKKPNNKYTGQKKTKTHLKKCCFKVIKLNVSKPDFWLSQTLRQ